MKREFKALANYVRLFDGYNKPKLNFQELYKLFPEFTFEATREFGSYKNFDQAFGHKCYDMIVKSEKGECLMVYKEYQDANESTAYIMC